MKQNLSEWLDSVEWYDNSTLSKILNCPRKAFYNRIHMGGLADEVGHGAYFGSSIHEALARYYTLWGRLPEKERRYEAFRAFGKKYAQLFKDQEDKQVKHEEFQGIEILTNYFDRFIMEDKEWKPLESELAFVVRFEPEPGDPDGFVLPFYYVCRVDGLWERRANGDLFIHEIKTTSGGVARKLTALKLDRQTTGYMYVANRFQGRKIEGVVADAILVAMKKREADRDVYYRTEKEQRNWRHQTIHIVQAWRRRKEASYDLPIERALSYYEQNTDRCMDFGSCSYFKLCYQSPHLTDGYNRNTWNPFAVDA